MKKRFGLVLFALSVFVLLVSCSQNVEGSDVLASVSINDTAKSLSASAVVPEVDSLNWFYTATKTSGFWKTGEKTTETALVFGESLGSFSTDGTWTFVIRGYKGTGTEAVLVYEGTKEEVTLVKNQENNLEIAVESQLEEGKVIFGAVSLNVGTLYKDTEVTLSVSDGTATAPVADVTTTVGENGIASFTYPTDANSKVLENGRYTYVFSAKANPVESSTPVEIGKASISFIVYKGYEVTISGELFSLDETGSVIVTEPAAQVGAAFYSSLASASVAADNAEITLLKSASGDVISADTTVSTNGFALENIQVAEGKTLTIKPVAGSTYSFTNGTISFKVEDNVMVIATTGGTLTIDAPEDDVNHTGTADVVDINAVADSSYHGNATVKTMNVKKGHVEISSTVTTLNVKAAAAVSIDVASAGTAKTINIEEPSVAGAKTSLNIEGTSTTVNLKTNEIEDVELNGATNPTINKTEGVTFENESILEGYSIKFTKADGSVKYSDKFGSITSGTYTLLKDVQVSRTTIGGQFVNNLSTVIDLGGHTLTSTSTDSTYSAFMVDPRSSNNSITFKNGTIVTNGGLTAISCGKSGNTINLESDLTINSPVGGVLVEGANTLNCAATINVSTSGVAAIQTNGSTSKDSVVNITGGTITAQDVAAYIPAGTLTISDGSLTGATALYVKSGNATISGGTFTGNGAKADFVHGASGCTATGDAVVFEACSYGDLTVNVTGGTFIKTATGCYGIHLVSDQGNTATVAIDTDAITGSVQNDLPQS